MTDIAPIPSSDDLLAALRESEERWGFALEGCGDGVWDWNISTGKMFYSQTYWQLLGFVPGECDASVEDFDSRIHPEDKPAVLESTVQLLRGDIPMLSKEYRLRCKDDSYKWVISRGKVVKRMPDGQPERVIGTISDITTRKAAEAELQLAAEVYERCAEAILIADHDNNILSVNRAFTEITGYSPQEVIGRNPRILSSGRQDANFYQSMWSALQTNGQWRGEIWNRRKNGRVYPEWLSISVVRDRSGRITRYIAIFSDISDSKQATDRLQYLATHDALTGLANMEQLQDQLRRALQGRQPHHLALLSLSLNHLRRVNAQLGHATGDQFLKLAAERLQQTAPADSVTSRQSGEQFHVLLVDLDMPEVQKVAQAVFEALSHFELLDGTELNVSPCIGISLCPDHGQDAASLLENAKAAMFYLIESGRHGFQFFTPDMNAGALQHMTLENSLRQALEHDEFLVHYQPIVDARNNRIVGAEALLRWKHPEMDMVSPSVFIELAEQSGVILPLGEWMMQRVCRQIHDWQAAGLRTVPVSVNLSARQFAQSDLPRQIEKLLKEHDINPFFLEIELSESTFTEELDAARQMIRRLKKRGIRVSVDDFGIGHASLANLKRFHIDKLKIDPSFVRNLLDDADDSTIVRAIVTMAHSLRLEVVAEGVETRKQLDFLKALNCDQAQGFLFSEALAADAFAELLNHGEIIPS